MWDYWLWWWDSWMSIYKSVCMPPKPVPKPLERKDRSFIGYGF